MKVIIQIPCYNEAETLAAVFEKMPREIPGIDTIEYQIIDDGSTDGTVKAARHLGVHHIVRIPGKNRRWLGRAFKAGIDHALKQGADIVVNTDGDNQYPSEKIPELILPIMRGECGIVIGNRSPGKVREFSAIKRMLQVIGNGFISFLTGEKVYDAVSGFRAYSRDALLKINVVTKYTYTVDTLIQAYKKGIDVKWIPIRTNPKTRESRLITNLFSKVKKSGSTILRLSTVYEPFKTFLYLGLAFLLPGLGLLGRYFYFYFFVPGGQSGHVQSIVIGGVLTVIGVQIITLGIIGDLLAVNRSLVEDLLTRFRDIEAKGAHEEHSVPESRPFRSVSN